MRKKLILFEKFVFFFSSSGNQFRHPKSSAHGFTKIPIPYYFFFSKGRESLVCLFVVVC